VAGGSPLQIPALLIPLIDLTLVRERAFLALKKFFYFKNNTEVINSKCNAFVSFALLRLFFYFKLKKDDEYLAPLGIPPSLPPAVLVWLRP